MFFIPILIISIFMGVIVYKIGHKKNGEKAVSWVITLISIIFGITVLVAGILLIIILDPKVEMQEDIVQVNGLYKRDIALEDIESVSLEEKIPNIVDEVNGISFGKTLRGTFRIEGDEISTMFAQKESPPYIYIRTGERLFVINFRENKETEELYREIMESLE